MFKQMEKINIINHKIQQLPKSIQKYIKILEKSDMSEKFIFKIKEFFTDFFLKYYLSLQKQAYKDFKYRIDYHFKYIYNITN